MPSFAITNDALIHEVWLAIVARVVAALTGHRVERATLVTPARQTPGRKSHGVALAAGRRDELGRSAAA